MAFSVNVLLYGDHPNLATRCLQSLTQLNVLDAVAEFRIGLNGVSWSTRKAAVDFAIKVKTRCHVYEPLDAQNVGKYPLMRRMFYDPARPVTADNVMWFDDDSYFLPDHTGTLPVDLWWGQITDLLKAYAVVGSLYTPGYTWTPVERTAIAVQAWFAGVPTHEKPLFATGGWWAARREFLTAWDYPFREIRHNGGDTILGELCRQQGAVDPANRLGSYKSLVKINADGNGNESKAKRRGITTPRPFLYLPPYSYAHHDFEVRVETFPC